MKVEIIENYKNYRSSCLIKNYFEKEISSDSVNPTPGLSQTTTRQRPQTAAQHSSPATSQIVELHTDVFLVIANTIKHIITEPAIKFIA